MFSREESKRLREQFWTSFGIVYRTKWIRYNTKIKEIELKFTFTRKYAKVSLDIIDADELIRAYYFEKLLSLKKIIVSEYLPKAQFEEFYELPEEKLISRLFVQQDGVSIHNRQQWPEVMSFLNKNMLQLEAFFKDYREVLEG